MNNYEKVKQIKEKYKEGMTVELIHMTDDYALEKGLRGKIDFIDSVGTIFVNWENGSGIGLIVGEDQFKIISEEQLQVEKMKSKLSQDNTLSIVTCNKKNNIKGVANFTNDNCIKVFEESGDGSDDKKLSYKKFFKNYKFIIVPENIKINAILDNNFEDYYIEEYKINI